MPLVQSDIIGDLESTVDRLLSPYYTGKQSAIVGNSWERITNR
jgi:hypothetical protein